MHVRSEKASSECMHCTGHVGGQDNLIVPDRHSTGGGGSFRNLYCTRTSEYVYWIEAFRVLTGQKLGPCPSSNPRPPPKPSGGTENEDLSSGAPFCPSSIRKRCSTRVLRNTSRYLFSMTPVHANRRASAYPLSQFHIPQIRHPTKPKSRNL